MSPRLAEALCALSLATDLANGNPLEKTLRNCLLSTALGRAVGLTGASLADLYYATLLRFIGCTSFAHEEATALGGDDVAARQLYMPLDSARPSQMLPATLKHLAKGAGARARLGALAKMATSSQQIFLGLAASHCQVARRLAERMGMSEGVRVTLGEMYERYDGRGGPHGIGGDALSLNARIIELSNVVELHHRAGGESAAVDMVRRRRGGQFDPRLASLFLDDPRAFLAPLTAPSAWELVLDAEPAPHVTLVDATSVARAFADFTDLKSTFTLGHSPAVAALCTTAASALGLDRATIAELELAALLHDIGNVSVATGIWEQKTPLGTAVWDRIRSHAYQTERILSATPLFAPLAALAAAHHERLDGSGDHRRVAAAALTPSARLLAAADCFHALTEARPHRPAHPREHAAQALVAEARAGRLDPAMVTAVLDAAGASAPCPPAHPLSAREVEVLALLARGASNKEIGAALGISPRTAGHHVAHIYDKIGVSTRAAAALYAVENALLG